MANSRRRHDSDRRSKRYDELDNLSSSRRALRSKTSSSRHWSTKYSGSANVHKCTARYRYGSSEWSRQDLSHSSYLMKGMIRGWGDANRDALWLRIKLMESKYQNAPIPRINLKNVKHIFILTGFQPSEEKRHTAVHLIINQLVDMEECKESNGTALHMPSMRFYFIVNMYGQNDDSGRESERRFQSLNLMMHFRENIRSSNWEYVEVDDKGTPKSPSYGPVYYSEGKQMRKRKKRYHTYKTDELVTGKIYHMDFVCLRQKIRADDDDEETYEVIYCPKEQYETQNAEAFYSDPYWMPSVIKEVADKTKAHELQKGDCYSYDKHLFR